MRELDALRAKFSAMPPSLKTAKVPDEFSQRLLRDTRFRNAPISRKSPKRSPLGNLTNSPIRQEDGKSVKARPADHMSGIDENATASIGYIENSSAELPSGKKFSPFMERLRSTHHRT